MESLRNALRRPKKHSPNAAGTGSNPGDGIGYPVPYTGTRPLVDNSLLSKCKTLAPYSGAFRLNDQVVMKTGSATRMCEADAMRLVAEQTTIPVPKVLDAYVQSGDGRAVILMEYIDGETLDKVWARSGAAERKEMVSQLHRYLAELRMLKGSRIGAVDGTSCHDQFFDDGLPCGPYETVDAFHDGLAHVLRKRADTAWSRMVSRFITSMSGHDIVFTHNDLAPRNILVRDANIVAILDWELSGYYPDYWEYAKTYLWADWDSTWVTESIPDQIMEQRTQELAALLHARDLMW